MIVLGRSLLIACLGSLGCSDAGSVIGSPPDGPRLVAASETILTGTVGAEVTATPTIRAVDGLGNPVPGIEVSFVTSGGGVITNAGPVRTNSEGVASVGAWTLGKVAGPYYVTARSDATRDTVVFTAVAEAGPPASMTRISEDAQILTFGLELGLRVRVNDAYDNPVHWGTPVSFVVTSGKGSIGASEIVTDFNGIARASWHLEPGTEVQEARAEVGPNHLAFKAIALSENSLPPLLFVRNGRVTLSRFDVSGDPEDGEQPEQPLTLSGLDSNPVWSPDGRHIAFVRHDLDWNYAIYVMDADGSNVELRAKGFHSPSWSPDGRTLAVAKGSCIYDCDVYLLKVDDDGSAPVHLASEAADPAWSPDGTKIAFVRLSGDDGYHDLYLINADGTGATALAGGDPASIDHPSWSPDSKRLVFAKCLGNCSVFTINADGSGLSQLTNTGNSLQPFWSPSGEWIGFTNWVRGNPSIEFVLADPSGAQHFKLITGGSNGMWH